MTDPIRVLIVDDHPMVAEGIQSILETYDDIRVVGTLGNGQDAVDRAAALAPDVILMDINLPGISGARAMRILADDPATAHIPVVALSANAMPRDVARGLDAGFFRYLTKPIKINEFMETLDVALAFSQATSVNADGKRTA